METNKIVGGLCATFLAFLVLNFMAELVYVPAHGDGEHHLAYSMAVEDHGDAGAAEEQEIDLGALFAAADVAKGEKVFKKCQSCHKLEEGANGTGPSLWGVVGRPIGSMAGFGYSGKLPEGQDWTAENLFHFLESPKKFAPGTSMGFAGLKKPEDRAAVIAYLNEADGSPQPLP